MCSKHPLPGTSLCSAPIRASGRVELPPEFDAEKHKFVPGESRDATDACPLSYRGFSGAERFAGTFAEEVMPMHINSKELLAILYGVAKGAGRWWQGCRLLLRCDNVTAVAGVNRGSHFLPHLDKIISDI